MVLLPFSCVVVIVVVPAATAIMVIVRVLLIAVVVLMALQLFYIKFVDVDNRVTDGQLVLLESL